MVNGLSISGVSKQFTNPQGEVITALSNVDLDIAPGSFISLIGPSGCGKSTLLRLIAGLIQPDSGTLTLDGAPITKPGSDRGFMFQDHTLFPWLTIYDNIAFGLKIQKVDRKTIANRVMELVDLIGLRGLERRYPSQLSGGQRQRVAFARALAPNPQLLLLDEPFAAIDAKVRQELRSWLKEMISKLGVTSIFVTHDQDEAIEVADEIIITNRGHIEQMGTPIEIYRHPQTAFTASFFGQTSVLADYQKYHTFQRMDGVEKAIVRPEFLKITRKNEVQKYGSSASKGVVERTSFRGDWIELAVRVHGDLLIAKRDLEEEPITVGETVDVFLYRLFVIAGEKCYLLENQSLQDDSVFI